ncbi:SDR family oxidoreductase [Dyadobacter sp. CY351]|uniref:SDR family oxidoreductase n=1 Tax=Dyadobacter sp. CY351 TaxID=2909337 RepID=UPI001F1BC061|nr:NAD(P)H-binding protein [Dyadobacter sp. CY351]MCF2518823.1 NAD(P)H-binding protein [Dyadobacter sp. CY351]
MKKGQPIFYKASEIIGNPINNFQLNKCHIMKILVIGGTGNIGSKVVSKLSQIGHEVIAGSPSTGINTVTGEGLSTALKDSDVVIDISNSPSLDEMEAIDFFQTSGSNLLAAAVDAGVKHHLVLSIVGVGVITRGYLAAKKVQEDLVIKSGLPYTIIRSTQFFEFVSVIASAALKEGNACLRHCIPANCSRGCYCIDIRICFGGPSKCNY